MIKNHFFNYIIDFKYFEYSCPAYVSGEFAVLASVFFVYILPQKPILVYTEFF